MSPVALGLLAFIVYQCNAVEIMQEPNKLQKIKNKLNKFGQDYGVNMERLHADAIKAAAPSISSFTIPFWDDEGYDKEQKIIIPSEIMPAFDRFVEEKKKATDENTRVWYYNEESQTAENYYKDICSTGYDLIQKCIEKRAIVFVHRNDKTLLRDTTWRYKPGDHANAHLCNYEWESVGTKVYEQTPPQPNKPSIEEYLSYDEMQLCANIAFAGPTIFYNDGGRYNNGKVEYEANKPNVGYLYGTGGPRFGKSGVMDPMIYVERDDHDAEMAKIIFGDDKYNTKNGPKLWTHTERESYLGYGHEVDVYEDLLGERYKISYGAFLKYVVATMKEKHSNGLKQAYVSLTALGGGLWTMREEVIILEAVKAVLDDMEPADREWISTIDFIHFKYPGDYKIIHQGINIDFSYYNKPSAKRGKFIIFVLFAWDGNSIPGNEFWVGDFAMSVGSSQAFINLNPFINTELANNVYTFVKGTTKGIDFEPILPPPESEQQKYEPTRPVLYQRGDYTRDQLALIRHYNGMGGSNRAIVLFSDNDVDKKRAHRAKRVTGGQAAALKMTPPACGWFDQEDGDFVAFGIITSYDLIGKEKGERIYLEAPSVDVYKKKVLEPASVELKKKLDEGYQIIVPYALGPMAPKKQEIFHNLGAGFSRGHLLAIQTFIDDLDNSEEKIVIGCFDPSKEKPNDMKATTCQPPHIKAPPVESRPHEGKGQLYYLSGWLDAKLFKLLSQNPKPAVVIFGDNSIDKEREDREERNCGGQAKALRMEPGTHIYYDQAAGNEVALGIVTEFFRKVGELIKGILPPNVKEYEEKYLEPEFKKLRELMAKGVDVIVPYGPGKDVEPKDLKKFYDAPTQRKQQFIFHSLGTGRANLGREYLVAIQKFIDAIDAHSERQIIASYNPSTESKQDIVATFPFADITARSTVSYRKIGKVYYQRGQCTNEQLDAIKYHNKQPDSNHAILLFSDNNIDKTRGYGVGREHENDLYLMQSGGYYDQDEGDKVVPAFGIVTKFYDDADPPDVEKYKKKYLEPEFDKLRRHINLGYDIIVPNGPNSVQFESHREKFYHGIHQFIFHNIGIDVDTLQKEHLVAIQELIDSIDSNMVLYNERFFIDCYDPSKPKQDKSELSNGDKVDPCKPKVPENDDEPSGEKLPAADSSENDAPSGEESTAADPIKDDVPSAPGSPAVDSPDPVEDDAPSGPGSPAAGESSKVQEPLAIVIPGECPWNCNRTAGKRVDLAIVVTLVAVGLSMIGSMFIYYR